MTIDGILLVICLIAAATTTYAASVCHCTSGCDKFPGEPCPDGCQQGWFGPYCQKENIALGRLCSQDSTYTQPVEDGLSFPARLAVDGIATNIFKQDPETCSHTAVETSGPSTWTLELNKTDSTTIHFMKVYLRHDNLERNKDMSISVNGAECFKWANPPVTTDVTCKIPLPGNKVTIQVPGNILTLCEVQVFLCSGGWFGRECDRRCNCEDREEVCDRGTGTCPGGCASGYTGTDCYTPCHDQKYGSNCSESCGRCRDGDVCNKTTGTCPRGCDPGFTGDTCHQGCPNGTYGLQCQSKCGQCQAGPPCNKETGFCLAGCAPGWRNQTCDLPCPDFAYGMNCSSKCGRCADGGACEKMTGKCLRGCEAGWKGNICNETCEAGKFGAMCSSECGHCRDQPCDGTSGQCHTGCNGNYSLPLCDDCLDGYYGAVCGDVCGMCEGGEVCEKSSGRCPAGCVAGYTDDMCKTQLTPANYGSHLGGAVGGVFVFIILVLVGLAVAFILYKRRSQKKKADPPIVGDASDDIIESPEIRGVRINMAVSPDEESDDEDEDEDEKELPPAVDLEEGDPYYNWVPPNLTLDKLKNITLDLKKRETLETQFKAIPYGMKHAVEVGKRTENKARNRFIDMCAYDHSRVKLEGEDNDYINASHIAGYDDKAKYIASQGPKAVTVEDFWQLVWQEEATAIVMLTQCVELAKKKCEQYWPNESEKRTFGRFTVANTESKVRADFTINSLTVRKEGCSERRVEHYYYTTWPDHGVPSAPALVAFWKRVRQGEHLGPLIVHCSAGVGRTGAFIALDSLVEEYEDKERLNVFTCVTRMREARMNMVQTLAQYQFIHDAVLEALLCRHSLYTTSYLNEEFGDGRVLSADMENTIQMQFNSISELRKSLSDEAVSDGLSMPNFNKNRDRDIVPDNNRRLRLKIPVAGSNDYINALPIPSAVRRSQVVVTQTPKSNTTQDYWTLVSDHGCLTLVCLDDSHEVDPVYPNSANPEIQHGSFTIRLSSHSETEAYTDRHLTLTNTSRNCPDIEIRLLTLKMTESPDVKDLLQLLSDVDDIVTDPDQRVLVHCCDGARLCGVFCVGLSLLHQLRVDRQADIFLTLREMQCLRPQFINSVEQYRLCHQLLYQQHLASSVYANV